MSENIQINIQTSGRSLWSRICLSTITSSALCCKWRESGSAGTLGEFPVTPVPSITIPPSLSSQRLICVARPTRRLRLIIHVIHAHSHSSTWHAVSVTQRALLQAAALRGQGLKRRRGVDYGRERKFSKPKEQNLHATEPRFFFFSLPRPRGRHLTDSCTSSEWKIQLWVEDLSSRGTVLSLRGVKHHSGKIKPMKTPAALGTFL